MCKYCANTAFLYCFWILRVHSDIQERKLYILLQQPFHSICLMFTTLYIILQLLNFNCQSHCSNCIRTMYKCCLALQSDHITSSNITRTIGKMSDKIQRVMLDLPSEGLQQGEWLWFGQDLCSSRCFRPSQMQETVFKENYYTKTSERDDQRCSLYNKGQTLKILAQREML